jgi:hypothetical protein
LIFFNDVFHSKRLTGELILIILSDIWSTAPYALKASCLISPISREMLLSTTQETLWICITERKWFELGKDKNGNDLPKTVIRREHSSEWKSRDEPYYPANDEKNSALYAEYKKLAKAEEKVIFDGCLAEYKYYDMNQVIATVLDMCEKELM